MQKFKEWMAKATSTEKKRLAEHASTSLSLLYQLSYETRAASPELAGRIETAIGKINRKNAELPTITRADLAPACAKCKYFKECQT